MEQISPKCKYYKKFQYNKNVVSGLDSNSKKTIIIMKPPKVSIGVVFLK